VTSVQPEPTVYTSLREEIRAFILRERLQPGALTAHRLIFEAISARDAVEARQLMDEHLEITGQISDDEG
jgi:DNA-binding FadR family transcriptional regulator